jgi:protein-S-isoprenylcysteine O-methyltransferase Ste14
LAIYGRLQLGGSWGIGTGYRPSRNHVVRRGIYGRVRHPIYLGTGLAIAAQALLLQNLPSLILLAGAAIINPWKMLREDRWIRRTSVED